MIIMLLPATWISVEITPKPFCLNFEKSHSLFIYFIGSDFQFWWHFLAFSTSWFACVQFGIVSKHKNANKIHLPILTLNSIVMISIWPLQLDVFFSVKSNWNKLIWLPRISFLLLNKQKLEPLKKETYSPDTYNGNWIKSTDLPSVRCIYQYIRNREIVP